MADTLLLRDVVVLATNVAENKDKTRMYRTAYCFVPGACEGYDGKPQVFEMSVEDDASFNMLRKNIDKPMMLVAEKTVWMDGRSSIKFFSELSEMMKNAPQAKAS